MSVSYEYYKIFYYVGKYHSFNKAAMILMNSQPNIARAINNLEFELGCKLFYRSHKGVTFTSEGEELFKHIQVAQRQIELGEACVNSAKNLKHGNVSIGFSIGITESLLKDIILPTLQKFHREYPDVHLQIFNNSTPQLISDITEELLDLAVVTTISGSHKALHENILHSFKDILIVGPSYKNLADKRLSLKELVGYPLISLWHGTETYEFYNGFFASRGVAFEPVIETATTGQVLSFVENDMGIGFISPDYAKKALKEKRVFKVNLKEELPVRSISLIQNSNKTKSSVAFALEQIILG